MTTVSSNSGSVNQTGAVGASASVAPPPSTGVVLGKAADNALGPQQGSGAVQLSDNKTPADPNKIASFAESKVGDRVGGGECCDLADAALHDCGFKSYTDFGHDPSKQKTYEWGKKVPNNQAKKGDILQFENYDSNGTSKYKDGAVVDAGGENRPHHTAIVVSNDGNGMVTVLEQNAPPGSPVVKKQLHIANGSIKNDDGSTTDWSVKGSVKCYEPIPKD